MRKSSIKMRLLSLFQIYITFLYLTNICHGYPKLLKNSLDNQNNRIQTTKTIFLTRTLVKKITSIESRLSIVTKTFITTQTSTRTQLSTSTTTETATSTTTETATSTTTETATSTTIETATSTTIETATSTTIETATSTIIETATSTTTRTVTDSLSCSPTQWVSDFSNGDQTWSIMKNSYGKENRQYELINDEYVMKVYYPNGSYIPSLSNPIGGSGFYATPLSLTNVTRVTFEYQVFFPDNFNFVKGGKLPGLFGGNYSCSGGNNQNKDCFSTRYMFRENGIGELYLYLNASNQNANYCNSSNIICNSIYGDSVGRGQFSFSRGSWTKISQTVRLNSYDNFDGEISVKINDIDAIYIDNIKLISDTNTDFIGIFFDTFFGGSTQDWATPIDQFIYFKNFRLNIDSYL